MPFVFAFFLLDSLPLASDKLGDPGRLSEAPSPLRESSAFFSERPVGVLVPLEDAPDLSPPFATLRASSSFFFLSSSSLSRSSSESSVSDCSACQQISTKTFHHPLTDSEYGWSESLSYSYFLSFLTSSLLVFFRFFFSSRFSIFSFASSASQSLSSW